MKLYKSGMWIYKYFVSVCVYVYMYNQIVLQRCNRLYNVMYTDGIDICIIYTSNTYIFLYYY